MDKPDKAPLKIGMSQPSIIRVYSFHAEHPGPRLLVFGAIHGNEVCGPAAIAMVLKEFEAGEIALARGSVTFVPVCNPEALARNVRFVERNLNRFLVPTQDPATYEARLGNILCPLLERCDVLLDIHSYRAGGPPFVFISQNDAEEQAFASSLGPETLVTGWISAYAKTGRERPSDPEESTGTTEYGRRFGAKTVTLECGGHTAPDSVEAAYRGIHNALGYLGLVGTASGNRCARRLVTIDRVYYRDQEGQFVRDWKHLETVPAGTAIARYAGGAEIRAPQDSVIVLPHADTPLHTEWFYLGVEFASAACVKPRSGDRGLAAGPAAAAKR